MRAGESGGSKGFLEEKRRNGAGVEYSIRLYSPREVYLALIGNAEIRAWLEFISNHYVPTAPKKILLIYPCSAEKPYHLSRSYRALFNTLDSLGGKRRLVHVVTISEPFGLVPEEFYGVETRWHDWRSSWYDCPGLFEWWCRRHGKPYEREYLEKSIQILASYVASYLMKAKTGNWYSKMIAFVRTYTSSLKERPDHTHKRIIELAARIAGVDVEIHPPKEVVAEIVSKHGRLAWDFYGVAHPAAQRYLLDLLKRSLEGLG